MVDRNSSDARAALRGASRVERQTRAASRWFPKYMLLLGLSAFALIVTVEAFFPTGGARVGAAVAWALMVGLLGMWAASHDVFPAGAGRRVLIAGVIWFAAYLFAIGPLVRWQAGTSLAWWSLASAVMASPFLVGAWWQWRRS
jgi:hypothetical protein